MDVAKKVLLAYLEEDNAEKVFFRLLPLMDEDGVVREEAIIQWPAQGGLRIVPDRNEQYHFKDRMRTLGSFCMLDLTAFPPEANKIRTNKNYNPERGEINQYIVYSDGIKELPESLCYQIIEEENWQEAMTKAATIRCYIKRGEDYIGPVDKSVKELPDQKSELQAEQIYTVKCPDEISRSIYWPKAQCAAQTPEEPEVSAESVEEIKKTSTADEPLEVGKTLNILDESKTFDDHIKDIAQPLSNSANLLHAGPQKEVSEQAAPQLTGTPLYRSAAMKPQPVKAHNPLHQIVETQWRAAKYEAPSAQLKQGADLRHVENPVDICREALNKAWASESVQDQVVDCILELPGMTHRMEKALLKAAGDYPLQGAVRLEIQEMEAERLALLVQLDKARENMASYREEALNALDRKQQAELNLVNENVVKAQKHLDELRKEINALTAQKEELEAAVIQWQTQKLPAAIAAAMEQAKYYVPMANAPTKLKLRSGQYFEPKELISRLEKNLSMAHDEAVNWLVLMALCPRVQFINRKLGDSLAFVKQLCGALGLEDCLAVQESDQHQPLMCAQLPAATPALLATPYLQPLCGDPLVRTAWLTESLKAGVGSMAYKTSPWPVVEAPAVSWDAAIQVKGEPVAMESLQALLRPQAVMSKPEKAFMESLHEACAPIRLAPCTAAFEAMAAYLKAASPLMQGGFTAACDFAVRQWLMPLALEHRELAEALRPALVGLPCISMLYK